MPDTKTNFDWILKTEEKVGFFESFGKDDHLENQVVVRIISERIKMVAGQYVYLLRDSLKYR